MNKRLWSDLLNIFEAENLKDKYSEIYEIISKICKSIELHDEIEKVEKELQELNKED